ncbi:hypothetical protein E2C01_064904 [Portunus trituberculatus]|uniref:Uncharacterized protein n=1 Tax=Portunus trituberculatus TaxID=210409 RepID=A0A5B7HLL8_PORTR|nr:hypothetical protein [Portunus trituberculatus]
MINPIHTQRLEYDTEEEEEEEEKEEEEEEDEKEEVIQKRFALSPRLFSKATEMISGVFKSASPTNNVEILPLCL